MAVDMTVNQCFSGFVETNNVFGFAESDAARLIWRILQHGEV